MRAVGRLIEDDKGRAIRVTWGVEPARRRGGEAVRWRGDERTSQHLGPAGAFLMACRASIRASD